MKILTLVFSILLLTSFKPKEELYIWYPYELGVVQTCIGQEVELLIEITTESAKNIKVHSFALDKSIFTIYKDNETFKATDTILLTKNSPIKLKVKYKISTDKDSLFTFKTDQDNYLKNQINIFYGQHIILRNDIRCGKEQFIGLSESCQDSITVIFPFGGTVSSATIYNDTSKTKKELKSVSYGIGDGDNFITFTKKDIGRYFVDFGSCHWGGEFWLTIK